VTEHHDEARAIDGCRELYAAHLRRRHDVAGYPDDEEVTEALVKHQFSGHAGVGAAQDDGERLLRLGQFRAARMTQKGVVTARVLSETAIAGAQPVQSFQRGNHGW